MGFTNYKNISEVCEKFDYDYELACFVKAEKYICDDFFLKYIKNNFKNNRAFISEGAICEYIISPIISFIADSNNLPIWSHIQFDVDKDLDLTGTPDYIFAPEMRGGQMMKRNAVACLGEAKKDDFILGWGQVAAEMYAAQLLNKNKKIPVYGLVSNGKLWEFGKLVGNKFTVDSNPHSAPTELNKIFDILNWMFCEARKNADKLLELEKK